MSILEVALTVDTKEIAGNAEQYGQVDRAECQQIRTTPQVIPQPSGVTNLPISAL
jgi:hypothetical protein